MIKNEWKSLLRNKLMLIVVIAIIVIPIIYAGLFLKSMWDPYGNVDSLPVAVVNEDKPVEYNGKTLSIGKDMTDELKDNDSMAFNIVDSRGRSGQWNLLHGYQNSGKFLRKRSHCNGQRSKANGAIL